MGGNLIGISKHYDYDKGWIAVVPGKTENGFNYNEFFSYSQTVKFVVGVGFNPITNTITFDDSHDLTRTTFMANSLYDLYYSNGSPIYYQHVTEYLQDAAGNDTGKTEYEYDHPIQMDTA